MFRHKQDDTQAAPPPSTRCARRCSSIGDDYWIENGAGERVFKVDGKALRVRKTLVFEDPIGHELCKIQERMRTSGTRWRSRGRRRQVATVKKALVSPLRERCSVEFDGGADLEACRATSSTTSTR